MSVMEIKRRYWCPDDAESCNENENEIEKQQRKKRKFTQDDGADYLINKSRKNCNTMKSRNVCACANESDPFDCRSTNEKVVCGKRIEQDELLGRINLIGLLMCLDEPCLIFKKLEVKDMEHLHEDIKAYLGLDRASTRKRYWEALLVVCDWELAKARKKEGLNRARVRGEISPEEFRYLERGLHASTEARLKFLLEGDSYSEIEKLQSEIESLMFSGSADVVEFWEPKLKHIRVLKAMAFVKEECYATIVHMNLEKDHRSIRCQEVDASYGGKDEQTEIEGAEGTGLSSSPELLIGEETGDNFEMMKTMGVAEEVMHYLETLMK
ncbi:hypothetical protein AgCh_039561 [Apium graveolens]